MRAGWLFAWCLVGCGAEIGGDDGADAAPPAADAASADAPGPDAAPPAMETTTFSVPDVTDTYLRLTQPTFNYGASERLCADTTTDDRRILFRIDVSSLPEGAEVVDATMHVWTGTLTNDLSTQTFSFYRMLEAWSEGGQNAAAGAASWNERQAGTAWTVAGAGVGSRDDVVLGSFTPDALDTEYAVPLAPEVVSDWIRDPAANFGLVMVGAGSDGGCFASTENATAGKHPTLVVSWIEP